MNIEVSRLTDESDLDVEDGNTWAVETVVPDAMDAVSDVDSCELTAFAGVGCRPRRKQPRHNRSPSRLQSKQARPVPSGEAASENASAVVDLDGPPSLYHFQMLYDQCPRFE